MPGRRWLTLPDLAQLRAARRLPPADVAIQPELERLAQSLRRQRRAIDRVEQAWLQLLPPGLSAATTLRSIRRGVLTVAVADATVRFELDRYLRSGGLDALRHHCAEPIARVRLVP